MSESTGHHWFRVVRVVRVGRGVMCLMCFWVRLFMWAQLGSQAKAFSGFMGTLYPPHPRLHTKGSAQPPFCHAGQMANGHKHPEVSHGLAPFQGFALDQVDLQHDCILADCKQGCVLNPCKNQPSDSLAKP